MLSLWFHVERPSQRKRFLPQGDWIVFHVKPCVGMSAPPKKETFGARFLRKPSTSAKLTARITTQSNIPIVSWALWPRTSTFSRLRVASLRNVLFLLWDSTRDTTQSDR